MKTDRDNWTPILIAIYIDLIAQTVQPLFHHRLGKDVSNGTTSTLSLHVAYERPNKETNGKTKGTSQLLIKRL